MKKDKRLFDRFIRMLDLIPVYPRKLTVSEIHKKLCTDGFEVSKRTVERDLIQLSESFGIFNDEDLMPRGWCWQKDSPRLNLPALTPEEALTFKLAESHLSGLMPKSIANNLKPYFLEAEKVLQRPQLYKGYSNWLSNVQVVHPWQPLIPPDINEATLSSVHLAIFDQKQLDLIYQSRKDPHGHSRIVNPLGLVIRGHITYLVCTIEPFTNVRLLAVHRIHFARVLDISSNRPSDFKLDNYVQSGALGFSSHSDMKIKLHLKMSRGAAIHLIESPLSNDQQTCDVDKQHIELKATVANTMQLKWWILGLGSNVEVLSPSSLREEISHEISEAMKQYN